MVGSRQVSSGCESPVQGITPGHEVSGSMKHCLLIFWCRVHFWYSMPKLSTTRLFFAGHVSVNQAFDSRGTSVSSNFLFPTQTRFTSRINKSSTQSEQTCVSEPV